MSHSAPLELLTDATGSVTFGWVDEGVFYARFSRCLSAKLGEAFAARLRAALQTSATVRYFGDGSALESYDLLARSAFVRVVNEHRRRFEQITVLAWAGGDVSDAFLTALGKPTQITKDPNVFEAGLLRSAPRARYKLGDKPDVRGRWPLRR